MKTKIIWLGVFIVALTVGLWSFSKATGNEITICVKNNGSVYVIGEGFKRADCKNNDQLLTWNVAGQKGEKGDPGEPGPQGAPGSNLKIVDNNDLEVGIMLSSNSAWNTELGKYLQIDLQSQTMKFGGLTGSEILFYKDNNCSGTPMAYVEPYQVYNIDPSVNPYGWSYITAKEDTLFQKNASLESRWDTHTIPGHCVTVHSIRDVIEIESITLPSFQGPFRIVEQ